jgi:hypothetical protein
MKTVIGKSILFINLHPSIQEDLEISVLMRLAVGSGTLEIFFN